jgi:uncharacterized protein YcbX/ferredoxin
VFNLSQIFIHPVKSMRGLQFSHAQVGASGLAFDRIFMLTDRDGKFITARQYPSLVCFTPSLITDGIVLSAPDGQSMTVRFDDFSNTMSPTEVWGSEFSAHIAPEEVNDWLSRHLKTPVQLRWVGPQLTRRIKRYPEIPLSFADGYPFLLINVASFEALQNRCPVPIKLPQFRPNFVVDGAPAFAEDGWKTVKIGDVIFDVAKPCSRCILTTVNIDSGKAHPAIEPLNTLKQFRSAENGDVDFGMNLIARTQGVVRVGDTIEVLETQTARSYFNNGTVAVENVQEEPPKSVIIDFDGTVFSGNNHQVLLEQLEQQGIKVNYSCRAGICGCCRVGLDSGEVLPLRKGAIKNNGSILACSCIPKTNIRLKPLAK